MDRIAPNKVIELDGRTWTLTQTGPEEQFEIECILMRMLGPATAVGLGVVVDALAKEVAIFLAQLAGKGQDFDLANLLGDVDTSDRRLHRAWDRFLAVLPDVAGNLLGEALPVFLQRLDYADLHRLMALVVFGRVYVQIPGAKTPTPVVSWKVLTAVLVGSSPAVKWRLLAEAIAFNYADQFARGSAPEPVDAPASEDASASEVAPE